MEGRDQRPGAVEERVDVAVGLALEVAHEEAEDEAEVDQEDRQDEGAEDDRGHGRLVGAAAVDELPDRVDEDDEVQDHVERHVREQQVAREEHEVEEQVPAFDVADLVRDDRVDLLGLQQLQERGRHEDVAEAADQAHDGGRDHAAAEERPGEDVGAGDAGAAAERLDPLPRGAGGERGAAPEAFDQDRAGDRHGQQEDQVVGDLALGRREQACRPREGQRLDQVQHGRHQGPGDQDRRGEREVGEQVLAPVEPGAVDPAVGAEGEGPHEGEVGDEERHEDQRPQRRPPAQQRQVVRERGQPQAVDVDGENRHRCDRAAQQG